MRKLRSRRGETLVETLVSLLIVVLVMAFLATSIVAATRVNAKIRDADVAVRYDGISEPASLTVSSGRGPTPSPSPWKNTPQRTATATTPTTAIDLPPRIAGTGGTCP